MLVPMSRLLFAILFCGFLCAADKTTTLAGNGTAGYSESQINNPYGLVIGPDGALYICEIGNHVVRRVDLKTRKLTTVAGTGKAGYSGDGGPATEASLNEPYEIAFDKSGNMYFVEMKNHLIRKVDAKSKTISTIAGNGAPGFAGDGGPALKAQLNQPHSISFDREGRLLICDIRNNRIRRIDFKSGNIDTIFTGTPGTPSNGPRAIAVAGNGDLYIAFREGNSVQIMHPDGKLELIASKLAGPKGISLGPDGGIYIADTESHAIRRIDPKTHDISVVADGLKRPHGVFVDKKGAVYIGDSENHRVLVVR